MSPAQDGHGSAPHSTPHGCGTPRRLARRLRQPGLDGDGLRHGGGDGQGRLRRLGSAEGGGAREADRRKPLRGHSSSRSPQRRAISTHLSAVFEFSAED